MEESWQDEVQIYVRHFELNFFMNAMVEMPDTGELKGSDFVAQEYVFRHPKDKLRIIFITWVILPTITQM